MSRVRIYLPKAEFYRVCQLQYSNVKIPKELKVTKGDMLLIGCEDYRGDCELDTVLVREIIDYDVNDIFRCNKKGYDVIVCNNNYLS